MSDGSPATDALAKLFVALFAHDEVRDALRAAIGRDAAGDEWLDDAASFQEFRFHVIRAAQDAKRGGMEVEIGRGGKGGRQPVMRRAECERFIRARESGFGRSPRESVVEAARPPSSSSRRPTPGVYELAVARERSRKR